MPTEPLDLGTIPAEWLHPCGAHDFGLPMACTCPSEGSDPRPIICRLFAEVERVRNEVAAQLAAVGLPTTGDPVKDVLLVITELYAGVEGGADKVRAVIAAQSHGGTS